MRLGVVCCDAGATNQLLAFIQSRNFDDLVGYFCGPANIIFPEFVPNIKRVKSVEEAVSSCDNLFTGTGWSSDVEHKARVLAAEKNIFSTAVLDHWVNYAERFTRSNVTQLPDRIIVFDEVAYAKASKCFRQTEVQLQQPYYKNHVLKKISKIHPNEGELLYICEPFRKCLQTSISLEEKVLQNFLTKLDQKQGLSFSRISIRPHPSERFDKYGHILNQFRHLDININTGDLAYAIGRASTVVGCSSYALYLAYHAGRRVLTPVNDFQIDDNFNMASIIPMEPL